MAGYILTVFTSSDATVTAKKDSKMYTTSADSMGVATFKKLTKGIWTITAIKGSLITTTEVDMQDDCSIEITLSNIPDFTYDGIYKIYNGRGEDITYNPEAAGNWKIEFLTSGKLAFNKLYGAENGIDVFCVGGGGSGGYGESDGGGGGGYTTTKLGCSVEVDKEYKIVIGSGGQSVNASGGNTSAFGVTANGGKGPSRIWCGANGGSGGGSQFRNGGSDGGGGGTYSDVIDYRAYGGTGQGTTTREFGESDGKLYAGGGGGAGGAGGAGGGGDSGKNGETNTGGGGGRGALGGSGIVVIRNKR